MKAKHLILCLVAVFITATSVILIMFYSSTKFINDMEIKKSEIVQNDGFTQPNKSEIKMFTFASISLFKNYYRKYVKQMDLKGHEKVLVFGSGAGAEAIHLSDQLSQSGNVTCLDLSDTWMQVAKKKLEEKTNVSFILGDVTKLNLEPNQFDIISIHFVLHDIPQDLRNEVIISLKKILKENGRINIKEPVSDNHGMTSTEVKEILKQNGFKQLDFDENTKGMFMKACYGVFEK